jgi:hypothetical protein
MPISRLLVLIILLVLHSIVSNAQSCEATIIIELKNSKGGFYADQKVTLTSKGDSAVYRAISNQSGLATLHVPCGETLELFVPNYGKKIEVESPERGGAKYSFSYSPNNIQEQKKLEMTPAETAEVDKHFESLPDSAMVRTSVMPPPAKMDYHAQVSASLTDIKNGPLAGETIYITGRKRRKTVKVTTDKTGRVLVYLPKGDTYDLGFKHHRNYYVTECPYTRGSTNIRLAFSYLGTKEVEKRMKEEAERLAAEEKRLKAEKERFEKRCAASGLTLEECHRREREAYLKGETAMSDTVINLVLSRNQWTDKLIVCDVTGSMSPYVAQVAIWYRLHYLSEKNLQFVLFNDGDNIPDEKKKIGSTGGIYYSSAKGVDSLDFFMSRVQAAGSGGDGPENNMEALIKGIKMASPFTDLVMIADNNAPVKDISLLSAFNVPVHIILCGADNGFIEKDYLKIARKTKGSIHTIEEDITNLSKLSEGKEITISGIRLRIMGGEFVEIR